jgi:hypothetical protein
LPKTCKAARCSRPGARPAQGASHACNRAAQVIISLGFRPKRTPPLARTLRTAFREMRAFMAPCCTSRARAPPLVGLGSPCRPDRGCSLRCAHLKGEERTCLALFWNHQEVSPRGLPARRLPGLPATVRMTQAGTWELFLSDASSAHRA